MALGKAIAEAEIEKLPFFNGKTYTISTDSIMPDNFSEFFVSQGISAGVFLPLEVNDRPGLYVAFLSLTPKKWTVDELKFLQDVKRVLQTVLLKRITKNSLASSYTALEAILENAGCAICVNDIHGTKTLYCNDRYRNLLDSEEDTKEIQEAIDNADLQVENLRGYYAENSDKWFDITFAITHWVDGREVRLATIYDVTDSKKYQQEIERRANIDYLTGLYNRKKCEEDLQHEIRKAKVTSALGALIYIDLDDFKNINDALGHRVGDHLLVEVAKGLERVIGADNKVYRVGGDEFAVLVPTTQYHNLEKICNKIVKLFSKSWEISEKEYYCTTSMGYVSFPKNGTDVQTLIQRADIALSYAKEHGKNRVEAFDEKEEENNTVRRLDLEKALRDAVADDCKEFEVYYQPVVNITEGTPKCCGAEALIRWHSKSFGFMNPAEFIPLAEYLGLIVPIGEHVLIEACKRCKYWNDFGHPEYKVNVNLSVVQLMQKDIVDTVAHAIEVTGINPANLTLEVTEGLAVNDMDAMKKVLNGLKNLGARVALDDFGTGYSSLNHIRSMPLDVIKIDKCFIDGVGDNAFSDAFVKTVSKLADAIDVNVCVEGVEEERQKIALDDMNIQMIQGFLYDRPLPQSEFEEKYIDG
ncbi:MAG: EAL domain-containing protein [Lachnospiraceae bacterium]|nr:EAL domain-containing protein [Lachnospiraceae bacterium]